MNLQWYLTVWNRYYFILTDSPNLAIMKACWISKFIIVLVRNVLSVLYKSETEHERERGHLYVAKFLSYAK